MAPYAARANRARRGRQAVCLSFLPLRVAWRMAGSTPRLAGFAALRAHLFFGGRCVTSAAPDESRDFTAGERSRRACGARRR